ncbi:MAG: UDP-N-acetylmuramoyl-L-alanine--D-glutamate ligase [Patescibacteria group bacterium]|nr:UDP-N-acetylmuramoyl-L-alanine--D-glutamate ligase [Patescibacteria group bacterium]
MQSWQEFFSGKRITVIGMGLLGGNEDISFLARAGAHLTVTDLKSEAELAPSLEKLGQFSDIRYTLGRHDFSDFEEADLVIQAPATPKDSPYILRARERGIPITMWAGLFARFARAQQVPIIGVTGTRGKTTVTAMLRDICSGAGRRVIEGGNIPGSSILSKLPELSKGSTVLLELDSWKLQGFREEHLSPSIAVFTSFYPDHLNYYGGDMDAYLADKAEIFLHQGPKDTLVIGEQASDLILKNYSDRIRARRAIASSADLPQDLRLRVLGEHNRDNAACALAAGRAMEIPDSEILRALREFAGVPGRLEFLREWKGVKIYNDTTATTPTATMAGLEALDPEGKRSILLIMGGADKELPLEGLAEAAKVHCKKIFLLAGSGTERIKSQFAQSPVYLSLAEAFRAATEAATSGESVVLSPAFASFGMFKNEYDRGAQFKTLAENLK